MIAVVACSIWISARAATGPDGQLNRAVFPPGIGASVRAIEPCPMVAAIFETPPDAPTTMLNAHVVDTTPGFYQGMPATLLTVEVDEPAKGFVRGQTLRIPYFDADFTIGKTRFCSRYIRGAPQTSDRIVIAATSPPSPAGFLAVRAENIGEPPWLWTPHERAVARRPLRHFDGATHPELFFVTELFADLVMSSYVTLPKAYPRGIMQLSDDVLRTPREWTTFTKDTAEFAALLRREGPNIDERKCAAMAAALRAVHRDFGAERFDRFLYVVVARNRAIAQSNVPDVLVQRDERCR